MFDLLSDETRRDPFPLYEQARRAAPVLHDPRNDAWMLFDYESVKRALSDPEAFSSVVTPPTGPAPDWLVFSDPPRHTKLRALVARAFTPRSIAALEPRVRAISGALLDAAIERGEADLAADYATPLPTLVIADLIGIPAADRPLFVRWSELIVGLSYAITGGEEAARAIQAHAAAKEEMRAYVAALVEERRRVHTDDLLGRLVEAEVDGERLTGEEILGFFQLLLSAGTETTTNLIDNAVLCFAEHPDQLARLRADPALLPRAVEEVARYRSPGQVMFRATRRDVELRGHAIPAGKFVLLMIGSANRDEQAFAEPWRFDVGRDPNPHLGFGHGIHFCLGASLARLEGRVALGDLIERADVELATAAWEPRRALHVHGPARLPVRLARRRTSAGG